MIKKPERKTIYLEPEIAGNAEERKKRMHKKIGWNDCCDAWEEYNKSREIDVNEIQETIVDWYRKHVGYFITWKIVDDVTLAKAIHERIYGEENE